MTLVYLINTSEIRWDAIKHSSKYFNDIKISEIEMLKNEKDKCNSLIGRLILRFYLKKTNLITGENRLTINYNKTGKPFIQEYKKIHFNISHSNGYVACAISTMGEIGVDIEIVKYVNINEYACVFTEEEFLHIKESEKSILSFYTLWTLKEAFLKALGQGFNLNPQMFNVLYSPVFSSNCCYYLRSIIFDLDRILSVCTINDNTINFVELSLNNIY